MALVTNFPQIFQPFFRQFSGSALNKAFWNLVQSSSTGITALAGGGQTGATLLVCGVNSIDIVVTAGDSCQLPLAVAGTGPLVVRNNTANAVTIYGNSSGSDTINGVASSTGISIPAGGKMEFYSPGVGVWFTIQSSNANGSGSEVTAAYNTNTSTASFTATAAQISGGISSTNLALTGTLAGAANITMPTAASLLAALPSDVVGGTYLLTICNQSSANFTWTVVTNTGITLSGTLTIPQNTWRQFVVTVTSSSTVSMQSVATGTYS